MVRERIPVQPDAGGTLGEAHALSYDAYDVRPVLTVVDLLLCVYDVEEGHGRHCAPEPIQSWELSCLCTDRMDMPPKERWI